MAGDISSGSSGLWVESPDIHDWINEKPSGNGRKLRRAKESGDAYEGAKPAEWTRRAACLSPASRRIHDMAYEAPKNRQVAEAAKWICSSCPVASQCLDMAMDEEGAVSTGNRHGVFGGLTPSERQARYARESVPSKGRADRVYRENLERWKDGARDREALKARNRQLQRNRRAKERRAEKKEQSA